MPHCCNLDDSDCERKYKTFNYPHSITGDKTLLTGIRGVDDSKKVYISGFYVPTDPANTTSFVYKGCSCGKGHFHNLNYPPVNDVATITNLYGPNNGQCENSINVVGNYTIEGVTGAFGCLYQGDLNGCGTWTTITPSSLCTSPVANTICHSTMGNLVVGNFDTDVVQGNAFIYNFKTKQYYNISNPDAVSITAYGIWYNGCHSYTICGGYTTANLANVGYVVDFNNEFHTFSNWQIYHFNNDSVAAKITHFDGITKGCKDNKYNLTGDWLGISDVDELGFFATIKRNCDGTFNNIAKWSSVTYPNATVTSGNSVYNNIVIGVYANLGDNSVNGYVSDVKKC